MHEVDELTNIVTDVVGDPTLPRYRNGSFLVYRLFKKKTSKWGHELSLNKNLTRIHSTTLPHLGELIKKMV